MNDLSDIREDPRAHTLTAAILFVIAMMVFCWITGYRAGERDGQLGCMHAVQEG